jgi:hypothetical protein
MVINQGALSISDVRVSFPGDSMPTATPLGSFSFARPREVPYPICFGKCVFMDTTFLPGTLTFQLFGHEIELLPRVLVIDLQEHPWQSGETIALQPAKGNPKSE